MSKVTGTVLNPFTYKGKEYKAGEEATLDAAHAARYEKLDYVKFPKAEAKKVEAAEEKKLEEPATKPPKTK